MAKFAVLNSENKVINIIVVDDNDVINNGGYFSKQSEDYLKNKFNIENLKQYSENGSFRFNAPGIGDSYDEINDAFIVKKPFLSWTLDVNFKWKPPVEFPNKVIDENSPDFSYYYKWSEEILNWVADHDGKISHVWNISTSSWETI